MCLNYFIASSTINRWNSTFVWIFLGDNSNKLCEICSGNIGEKCTSKDNYAGFEGAFKCLVSSGDLAFLKHTTIDPITKNNPRKTSSQGRPAGGYMS